MQASADGSPARPAGALAARGVTPRAILIAVLLMPLNAYWITQMAIVRYEGHPTTISLFFNCVFILLVLMCANWAVDRLLPGRALHRNELLVIYMMLCLASAMAGHDMVQVCAPEIPQAYWRATPENRWEDLFFRYLPRAVTLSNLDVMAGAYEGGSTLYTRARLLGWGRPVLNWTLFASALLLMMLSLNVIFRKRWMEREKLTYPIVALPLEMTSPTTTLFRQRMLWIGFGLAAMVDIINGLHELNPAVPLIPVRVVHFDQELQSAFIRAGHPWTAIAGTRISFYPFAIGLGMLLPADLLFSCWFFYMAWAAQRVLSAWLGWSRIPGMPFVNEQSSAAYIGLCLFALWTGRQHVRDVLRRAVGRPSGISDEGEPMRYRSALVMLGLGAAFLIAFSSRLGMSAWVCVLFFILYFLISLSVTRIRAELGPPAHDLHYGGPDQILVNAFGTRSTPLGPWNLMSFAMCWWFNRAYRSHPMPHQLESFKVAEQTRMEQRRMVWALVIAGCLGTLIAFWANIHCYYVYGMEAKMSFVALNAFGVEPYQHMSAWMSYAEGTDWPAMAGYGVGLIATLALMALRMRFTWWPFHPVGYAISSSWSMNCLWMPLLIAWLAKTMITRYGGYKMFRAAIPMALGLILGEFVVGSLWTIIGIVLGIHTYSFWV
jgi:hypothetical protein